MNHPRLSPITLDKIEAWLTEYENYSVYATGTLPGTDPSEFVYGLLYDYVYLKRQAKLERVERGTHFASVANVTAHGGWTTGSISYDADVLTFCEAVSWEPGQVYQPRLLEILREVRARAVQSDSDAALNDPPVDPLEALRAEGERLLQEEEERKTAEATSRYEANTQMYEELRAQIQERISPVLALYMRADAIMNDRVTEGTRFQVRFDLGPTYYPITIRAFYTRIMNAGPRLWNFAHNSNEGECTFEVLNGHKPATTHSVAIAIALAAKRGKE